MFYTSEMIGLINLTRLNLVDSLKDEQIVCVHLLSDGKSLVYCSKSGISI